MQRNAWGRIVGDLGIFGYAPGRWWISLSSIDVFICKLRKKLAQAGAASLIGTVWGRGYMMRDPNSQAAQAASSLNVPEILHAAA